MGPRGGEIIARSVVGRRSRRCLSTGLRVRARARASIEFEKAMPAIVAASENSSRSDASLGCSNTAITLAAIFPIAATAYRKSGVVGFAAASASGNPAALLTISTTWSLCSNTALTLTWRLSATATATWRARTSGR